MNHLFQKNTLGNYRHINWIEIPVLSSFPVNAMRIGCKTKALRSKVTR
jgi:hypothetical protein